MATVLAQVAPAAGQLIDIYQAPVGRNAVVSLLVCNRSATKTNFRAAVAPAGAPDAVEQYVYYDVLIQGNDTFAAPIAISLSASDVIRVYATDAKLSFSLFGGESVA